MRSFAVMTLGAVLAAGVPAAAHTQPTWQYQGQGQRGYEINRNSAAFRDGFNRGREDAVRNRGSNTSSSRWRSRRDREAYAEGYNQGYQEAMRTRGPDRGRDRPNDRPYDQGQPGRYGTTGPGGWMNSARDIGRQDGVNDGANDRRTGHSFRPTQGDNYKNADRGYNSSMGSRDQYKAAYREGYASGYQQGYRR